MSQAIKAIIETQEEDFSFDKDFLSLSSNPRIKRQMMKYGETLEGSDFLSESVFIFNSAMKKKRVSLMVNKNGIFVFQGKKLKLVRRSMLSDLDKVSISSKNCTLIALHFIKGFDLMIETYRRVELILYIAMQMKQSNIKLFKLSYSKRFKLKSKKKGRAKMDAKSNAKAALPHLQEVFRNSKRMGFMRLYKSGFFVDSFKEYFFIITNLGLVYYKNYGVRHFLLIF